MDIIVYYSLEREELYVELEDDIQKLLYGSDVEGFCDTYRGIALSEWSTELLQLLANIAQFDFTIFFEGEWGDYKEFKYAVDSFNQSEENIVSILLLKNDDQYMDVQFRQLKEMAEQLQWMSFEPKTMQALEEATRAEIAVVATMSSGKSTLINALLGHDLMPTRNEATTASITKIYQHYLDIYQARALDHSGEAIDGWEDATLEQMEQYNDDPDVHTTELRGPVHLESKEGIDLVLVDTPGPNNSQDASHKKATFDYIQSKELPLILYVLNATQLGIEDDHALLRALKREMEEGGRLSSKRFLFVLNKIDTLDPERESMEHVMNNARQYLESHGIQNPRIFPITAKFAQLLRMDLRGETLGRKEQRLLQDHSYLEEDYQLLDWASLLPRERESLEEELQRARERGDEREVSLFYTGLPALEKAIEHYVDHYGLSALVPEIQQVVWQAIEEVLDYTLDMKATVEAMARR